MGERQRKRDRQTDRDRDYILLFKDPLLPQGCLQSINTISDEVSAEQFARDLYDQTKAGKYKLVSTKKLKKWVDKKSAVVVDTMPAGWYAKHHIPGAVQATAGGEDGSKGPAFKMTKAEKKRLLKVVKKATKGNKNKNKSKVGRL